VNLNGLSRVSLFADHLHITMGCNYNESPQEAALSYLNNLAYAHGMTEVYRNGYYLGTFGCCPVATKRSPPTPRRWSHD
jgi:hypothetical protein